MNYHQNTTYIFLFALKKNLNRIHFCKIITIAIKSMESIIGMEYTRIMIGDRQTDTPVNLNNPWEAGYGNRLQK